VHPETPAPAIDLTALPECDSAAAAAPAPPPVDLADSPPVAAKPRHIAYVTGLDGWGGEPTQDDRESFCALVEDRLTKRFPGYSVEAYVEEDAHQSRVMTDDAEIDAAALTQWIGTDVWQDWCGGERVCGPAEGKGNAIAGHGQHSHEVPSEEGCVVRMRDGYHEGTEVYRVANAFRFVSLDQQSVATADRCLLVRCAGLPFDDLSEPFACDGEPPDGLALVGVEADDDLSWLGGEAEILWDSRRAHAR